MPSVKRKAVEIDSLVGGLDTFINPTEIDDSSTPDCDNVIPTGKGGIRTRLGRVKRGGEITSGYGGQGGFTYIKSDNTVEELNITNGVLKKKNGDSWDTISGGTFSTTARVYGVQVGSRLYFADGETALCYYNGTEISTAGINSAPLPSFLIFFNRRIYCNDIDHPDRYYFGGAMASDGTVTNTGDFRSTSPAYGGYAGFGLGEIAGGLAKLGSSYLIVGLRKRIHRISPTSDTGVSSALTHAEELVSGSIGFANHGSIDNVENDLAFLSWGDIYLLGEVASYTSLRTRVISTKVSTTIQGISASMIPKTTMLYSPKHNKLYFGYADGTAYNNKVLVYDTYYKSWWRYSNWSPACFLEFVDENNQDYLIYVSDNPSDSYCYLINSTANDDGSAIPWHWKSKVFDLKGFDVLKKFKRRVVLFGPIYGTVTITVYIGGTGNTSKFQVGSLSGSAGLGCVPLGRVPLGRDENEFTLETVANDWRWKRIARPNEATNIQIKFSGDGVGEAGQIEKFKFYYNENLRKKDRSKRI
jgi:hypothetical protein